MHSALYNWDSVNVLFICSSLGLKEDVTVLTTGKHFLKCCPVEKPSMDFSVVKRWYKFCFPLLVATVSWILSNLKIKLTTPTS